VQRSFDVRQPLQRPDLPRTIWHEIDLVADSLQSLKEITVGSTSPPSLPFQSFHFVS
jgi:hypothetical protein